MTYNYVEFLKNKLIEASDAKKPQRTELQIEISVASLLGEKAYHAITVDMITERANIAHGTFYRYFDSKQGVVAKTIADYFDFVRATRPKIHGVSDLEAITIGNRHYVRCFRENVGLMRCHFHLKDEDDRIAEVGRRADRALSERIIGRLSRQHPIPEVAMPRLRLCTYAIIGMVDELLLKVYGQMDHPLVAYVDEPDMIADTLTKLWYSALADFRA
ncbi:TetR/AcrR family transcriptional regulator [Microvirga sp. BT689]|uniref:TetR/AcrR family transcriptional regulator n=1 Tax=Microvirga arvi TaxID=2778731 RepID=UPI0019510ACD|nr:TetR/AcrR family transcriptional regulator [Microvirga arvi]MBM6582433.1 TetR/AcrR family transcriptional regulator [Microvirga arvi]